MTQTYQYPLQLQVLMYEIFLFSRDNPPLELFAYTGRHIDTSSLHTFKTALATILVDSN